MGSHWEGFCPPPWAAAFAIGACMEPPAKVTEKLLLERLRLDAELERHRRPIAVMFVDIAGSTQYYEQRGDLAGVIMVQRVETLLLPLVQRHGGALVKTMGDAIMARFEASEAAVRCAVEMQRAMAQHNEGAASIDQIRIRAALNFGYGFVRGGDIFGDSVNVAARIEGVAEPGEILISPSVYEQIQHLSDLPVRRKASGVELKGKSTPLDLYQVEWQENAPRPPQPDAPSVEQLGMATGVSLRGALAAQTRFVLVRLYWDGSVGERHPIDRPSVTAGCGGGAQITLPSEPCLAPLHACFRLHDGLYVEELEKERGVLLRLREKHKLKDGEVFSAGCQRFLFAKSAAPVSAAAPPLRAARPRSPSPAASPAASLLLLDEGNHPGERFPLARETVLGRTQGTYTFTDDFMSRKHCRIYLAGAAFILEDLGSRNGTFVRIHRRRLLSEGDVVLLGSCLLQVATEPV